MISVTQESFDREVLQSSHMVLINFWAPWCGLCTMLQPILNRLESEWETELKIVSVNADQNLRLANNYSLSSLPTLILMHRGEIIERLESFHNREHLYKTVNDVMLHLLHQTTA
ncbi:thioredoxin 1 [Cyanobacterium sp. HL-69]|uniref:thioredoxin family protein n=1 Tax=unclassified Cyanobacterium TaxID=2629879 RepID=UPI00085287F8|nr:thioredoxin domain-containing protein [Cyanobacterium sp. IPPAS B-1200]AUC60236.1 thioredoxin 1 [Cyanobacterium sp. HL-69]OEJ79730.1 thiol reductase thioredoxin [Cyanobacterium sp. IPPAS B-1200]